MSTLLFDWGDTLMRDFPHFSGKMKDWPRIECLPGAKQTLKQLATRHSLYVATNAVDSSESDILEALARAKLSSYFSGIFCRQTLGNDKTQPDYWRKIATQLADVPDNIYMIGDSQQKDMQPAKETGFRCIWFNHRAQAHPRWTGWQITALPQLIEQASLFGL